jgi:hypothetical protein
MTRRRQFFGAFAQCRIRRDAMLRIARQEEVMSLFDQ